MKRIASMSVFALYFLRSPPGRKVAGLATIRRANLDADELRRERQLYGSL
jgi:hypothetical protein